jgi:hypothetical protein
MFERRNSKYPLQVNVDLWADVGRASTQMLPDYEQWRLGRGRRSATVLAITSHRLGDSSKASHSRWQA